MCYMFILDRNPASNEGFKTKTGIACTSRQFQLNTLPTLKIVVMGLKVTAMYYYFL